MDNNQKAHLAEFLIILNNNDPKYHSKQNENLLNTFDNNNEYVKGIEILLQKFQFDE